MTYRRRFFTEAEIIEAKRLRLAGAVWRTLGAMFSCDYATVRRVIEPEYSAHRAQQIAAAKRGERISSFGSHRRTRQEMVVIPELVLADRDRRLSASQSLTALLCGDPAPGQSALDKRGAA